MIAVINYNAGNVQSVLYALQRLGADALLTDDTDTIRRADKVIFPGVGNAASAMEYLRAKKLDELIVSLQQPLLGICLGLQLLCNSSREGDVPCLGIFDTDVQKFPVNDSGLKIPHMGWNTLTSLSSPLFLDIRENDFVYFVHTYYAGLCEDTVAVTEYGLPFSAALQKNNFYGVQFHAEKSAHTGEQILVNFLNIQ